MTLSLAALPNIETPRLLLRPLRAEDAETFRVMTDDPMITEAVHFLTTPFTITDARRLIADNGRDCFWGIWLRDDGRLIGTVGTHLQGALDIEIGYWLARSTRGHGFATEAATHVVRALKTAYPEHLIFAECRAQNTASWRLLERIGFRADGREGSRPGRKRLALT
jgi:RimJ/RimL family protein N-acetyltransferase